MASKYVEDLRNVAKALAGEGWDRRATICYESANRMERMEALIVEQMVPETVQTETNA